MTRIGGNKPPKDSDAAKAAESPGVLRTEEDKQQFRSEAAKQGVSKHVTDRFEAAAPKIEKVLASSGKAITGKIQFSNEELAQLAAAFGAILKQYPRADRKERARLFARAILKK